MSETILEIYDPFLKREEFEATGFKPRKPVTRALKRRDQVLDYGTLIKSDCSKCVYFHSVLNDAEDRSFVCNSQDIENFIMNLSLPLPVTGSLEISSRRRRYHTRIMQFPDPIGTVEETVAGSSSEGLWLPQMTHIKGQSCFTDTPDEDKKYIFSEMVVNSRTTRAFAVIEPSVHSPPPFVNLRYNERFMAGRGTSDTKSLMPKMFVRSDGLIDRNKFVSNMRSVLKSYIRNYKKELKSFKCKDADPKVTFSQHGPAITVEVEDEAMKQLISTDYVICLPCPQWPKQAGSWKTRTRVWPEKSVVRKIVREGCHIVPKPFKQGKLRETEFIFSFSLCDKTLAQHLSLNQKRCYVLFKYLFKYRIARIHRGLTSYHCKTTFFWVCERKVSAEWQEHDVLECLIWLFDALRCFLKSHNLPHYYISENNLICEMSKASIEACIKDIDTLMLSPAKAVLDVSENHRLSFLARDVSLQNLLQPMLDSMSTTKQLLRSYLLKFVSEMLDKGEIGLVISSLCQKWASDIAVEAGEAINVLEHIVANDYVVNVDDDEEDHMICLRGLLANLYHQKACENMENIGSWGSDMDRCLDTYQSIFDHIGRHIWIYGACYDCMYQVEWYEELVKHFLAKVNSGFTENTGRLYEPGIYTVISSHNHLTTYPDELADMLNFCVIPSAAYILHKVAYAYMALAKDAKSLQLARAYKDEANKVLIHLEKWVKQKCDKYPELEDDSLYYLLGLTAKEVGNVKVLRSAFSEAVKYGTTFRGFEVDDEPQFHDDNLESKHVKGSTVPRKDKRYHPYLKENANSQVPADLRFAGGAIRVGPYLHT